MYIERERERERETDIVSREPRTSVFRPSPGSAQVRAYDSA